MQKLTFDSDTIALYHFDEGSGNEARSACGDPELTLRAKAAQWGERPGSGAVARFERREDDATVFVGPTNNDKLHLRPCTEAWTVEAWVRYRGPGGENRRGNTHAQICGAGDDEGFGLNGVRGGWYFGVGSGKGGGKLADGIAPCARFQGGLGKPPLRDPHHDTSGHMWPDQPLWQKVSTTRFIRDDAWHHIAWQFRYADQTHYYYVDGRLLNRIQFPNHRAPLREVVNDAENVGVPFTVGGFVHSQNPPFFLGHGNLNGEIAELRISRIPRYPVADRLSIVKKRGHSWNHLHFIAAKGLRYHDAFTTDAAEGTVRWSLAEGNLPEGMALDAKSGAISGCPTIETESCRAVLQAADESGHSDRHLIKVAVRPGRIITESLPPAFVRTAYEAPLVAEHFASPLSWIVVDGDLPEGLHLRTDTGCVVGAPASAVAGTAVFRVRVTDVQGACAERALTLRVLPGELAEIRPDAHTVFLYDWQGEKARLIPDVAGDKDLSLDWTNMGGDRRVRYPGRPGRFPQELGHGEHGFASLATNHDKHNLRTCPDEWTVEAWVRRGGPNICWGAGPGTNDPDDEYNGVWYGGIIPSPRFDYGHICGTYDTTEQGVWELYLSDEASPYAATSLGAGGVMAPGVHFFGAEPEQALKDLHPWKRPEGIVGDPAEAGIRDTEWHHVAWQYRAGDDLHELFLDGRLIWRMQSPDGRRLVNNRRHNAQFSVLTRINGYVIRGHGEDGAFSNHFNYRGRGNFFGQMGEIRVSNARRYRRE